MTIDLPFFMVSALLVAHMVLNHISVHKLINKIMSGHYSTYQAASNIGKPRTVAQKRDDEPQEDLSYLQQVVP